LTKYALPLSLTLAWFGHHKTLTSCLSPKDDIFQHLMKQHYTCHICEKNGIKYHYFKNYKTLERHFRQQHFLCEERTCLNEKFIVFATALDLRVTPPTVQGEKQVELSWPFHFLSRCRLTTSSATLRSEASHERKSNRLRSWRLGCSWKSQFLLRGGDAHERIL